MTSQTPQEKKCDCFVTPIMDGWYLISHLASCPLYTPPAQEEKNLICEFCGGDNTHADDCSYDVPLPPQPKEPETNKIKEYSKFIECKDCTITTMNDDDNVCLKCGSKNTKRLFMDNNFKKSL